MDDRTDGRIYCALASLAGLKFVGFVLVEGELGLKRATLLRSLVARTERVKAKALIREAERLCERRTERRSSGRGRRRRR